MKIVRTLDYRLWRVVWTVKHSKSKMNTRQDVERVIKQWPWDEFTIPQGNRAPRQMDEKAIGPYVEYAEAIDLITSKTGAYQATLQKKDLDEVLVFKRKLLAKAKSWLRTDLNVKSNKDLFKKIRDAGQALVTGQPRRVPTPKAVYARLGVSDRERLKHFEWCLRVITLLDKKTLELHSKPVILHKDIIVA